MPITHDVLYDLLSKAFPGSKVTLTDLAGDNDHWQALIESSAFAGKSRLEQHRMVQDAVSGHNIHALSIRTQLPVTHKKENRQ